MVVHVEIKYPSSNLFISLIWDCLQVVKEISFSKYLNYYIALADCRAKMVMLPVGINCVLLDFRDMSMQIAWISLFSLALMGVIMTQLEGINHLPHYLTCDLKPLIIRASSILMLFVFYFEPIICLYSRIYVQCYWYFLYNHQSTWTRCCMKVYSIYYMYVVNINSRGWNKLHHPVHDKTDRETLHRRVKIVVSLKNQVGSIGFLVLLCLVCSLFLCPHFKGEFRLALVHPKLLWQRWKWGHVLLTHF